MGVPSNNITVCLVSDQLAGGGAERFSAQLSTFLVEKGIQVHHVLVLDAIEYAHEGEVFNLGRLKRKSPFFLNRFRRFFALRHFFKTHSFHIIIDTRVKKKGLQELFIHRLIYRSPYILIVHSARAEWYVPWGLWGARWIYQKAAAVVAVSKGIQQLLESHYGLKNVTHIPVAYPTFPNSSSLDLPPFILAVGRMNDPIKQYDRLIAMYAQSELPQRGIHLIILGEGYLLSEYQKQAAQLVCSKMIHFHGRVTNPHDYYTKALFSVLTSKNEGFPTVLLESLFFGTPVIAYNCPTGPNEIIQHEYNGLLVSNQDETAYIQALNRMICDKELYLRCKDYAKSSVAKYSMEHVGAQWINLISQKL
ncbi:glycosyltransferase [Flavobacterium sp.]|uniref:glycosyltransferase n=1 Tax=Flavobacterium sp. TaxID=239 RepID=UPI0026112E2F|nr:glycosyltransferase [Flavobacterium sp.]